MYVQGLYMLFQESERISGEQPRAVSKLGPEGPGVVEFMELSLNSAIFLPFACIYHDSSGA